MYSAAGIYLGYVGFANLGDEAMLEVCRRQFSSIRWTSFSVTAYAADGRQFLGKVRRDTRYLARWFREEVRHQRHLRLFLHKAGFKLAAWRGGKVAMLGGGTLINSDDGYLNAYKELGNRTGRGVPVFGAGVSSPEFMASRPGWTDRRREWVSALRALPIVGVRGPISKQLLEEAGAENVMVCGDPAVMFHTPLQGGASRPRADGRRRIGINCGQSQGRVWGDEAEIQSCLASVARTLSRSDHEVRLLAVCPEDLESCRRVARDAGLSEAAVAPVFSSPERFLQGARELDCLVAFKLHAAVLAAAANLPFVSLAYRPKCLDFAASVGWEDYTLRTGAACAETILDLVNRALSQLPGLQKRLCDSMCRLSAQFDSYCRRIEPLLIPGRRADV